jgi:hypothetical protein
VLALQSQDPREFVALFSRLHANAAEERAVRHRGRLTAKHYTWSEIIQRNFAPRLDLANGNHRPQTSSQSL